MVTSTPPVPPHGSVPEPVPTLAIELCTGHGRIHLSSPVSTASGCAANGRELAQFGDLAGLGFFTTKTVMREPRSGRGTPRMAETPSGMLNSVGLQGPGIDAFLAEDLPLLSEMGARVLVSVAGNDPAEFAEVARRIEADPHAGSVIGLEVNISCPNVANRGLVFACDPDSASAVLAAVRHATGLPLFAKLSPDGTDIVNIADAVVRSGADGLTAINTTLGVEIDPQRLRPRLVATTGGLSGPAIRPTAVRVIWQLTAAMRAGTLPVVPVIGVGGIASAEDALALLAAGASAVQVGTALFHDPTLPWTITDELPRLLAAHGLRQLSDAVGIAHTRA